MGAIDIVSASAGSGKTYNMAYRYIRTLIENPTDYRHILAVTFTNKATDELKERILNQLHSLAQGTNEDFENKLTADTGLDRPTVRRHAAEARSNILHDYNNFSVMTIDKFFQRVMRAFIKELDVNINFNLELKTESLISQAADLMLDRLSENEQEELRSWVMYYVGESIEDGEGWNIKKSLVQLGKELFKEEFRDVQISPKDKPVLIKIVTEAQRRASVAMEEYQRGAKHFVRLMDDNALLVSDFFQGSRGPAGQAQKAASGQLVKLNSYSLGVLDGAPLYGSKCNRKATIDAIAPQLLEDLNAMRQAYPRAYISFNTANTLARLYREFALLADLREALNKICDTEGILPISDVGELIRKLISGNEAPFIYEKSGNRYTHFMIDEFQDTSTLQWRNFVPLLHNAVAQSEEPTVMLVGDVKQSIYRWRGGDWSLLASGVKQEFREVNTSSLQDNYRSKQQVVEFNNALIGKAVEMIDADVKRNLHEAHSNGFITTALRDSLGAAVTEAYNPQPQSDSMPAYCQSPHDKSGDGYVTVQSYNRKEVESGESEHPIVACIRDLQDRGYRASDIAVLVRRKKDGKAIASLLLEKKNEQEALGEHKYVFDVVTQEALEIGSSHVVRFVAACMELSVNPNDRIARATYNQFLGRSYETALPEEDKDFIGTLALLQPEEAFNHILLHYAECNAPEHISYLQAFHSQIIDYCSRKIADTALFLKWWNESGHSESLALPKDADAITIATIHKAKGLGYNVVIVPYCDWSIRPKNRALIWASLNTPINERITKFPVTYRKDLAETDFSHAYYTEQTLTAIDALNTLYVALTRAKEELHLMVNSESNANSVGQIILSQLEPEKELCTWGTPTRKGPRKPQPLNTTTRFDTWSPEGKLAVRYSHQRYDEDSRGEALSPRDMGTLMHRVFEQASTLEEVETTINALAESGEVSAADATLLGENIAQAMDDERIREWFADDWSEVYTEREIIDGGHAYRPDRVMTRGHSEAVIVDYKFGLAKPRDHSHQIETYAALLQRMGYEKVSGYLWYISTKEIVQVV